LTVAPNEQDFHSTGLTETNEGVHEEKIDKIEENKENVVTEAPVSVSVPVIEQQTEVKKVEQSAPNNEQKKVNRIRKFDLFTKTKY
jgi:hypothetical protein